jgi:hypothetical protein
MSITRLGAFQIAMDAFVIFSRLEERVKEISVNRLKAEDLVSLRNAASALTTQDWEQEWDIPLHDSHRANQR